MKTKKSNEFRKTRSKRQIGAADPDPAPLTAQVNELVDLYRRLDILELEQQQRREESNRERTVQPGTGPDSPRSVANLPEYNHQSPSGGKRKTRKAKKSRKSRKSRRSKKSKRKTWKK